MKNLDKNKVGCGIFVDLQKAFDTDAFIIFYKQNSSIMKYVVLQVTGLHLTFGKKTFVSINYLDQSYSQFLLMI